MDKMEKSYLTVEISGWESALFDFQNGQNSISNSSRFRKRCLDCLTISHRFCLSLWDLV